LIFYTIIFLTPFISDEIKGKFCSCFSTKLVI
jgi:hypothetical protein